MKLTMATSWLSAPALGVVLLSHQTTTTHAMAIPIVKNVAVPSLTNGMDFVQLGDMQVSKVCMGTMTFGEQNTIDEGVEQLNLAFDKYGINFLDTAEMYPVPTKPTTQGLTDAAVSKFLKGRNRQDVILATKVSGRSDRFTWLPRAEPNTTPQLSKEQILYSVDKSLERLGTDYIDLLQLHWPDRYVGSLFGQDDFSPSLLKESIPFEETLEALQILIDNGKVRNVGVSNETPYGVCSMVALAKSHPTLYPKIVSIQNSYSLVVRKDFEAGLAEACHHHNVGLLPYSPLAGGVLTGKYSSAGTALPEKARLLMFPGFMDRYLGSQNEAAVNAYAGIATEIGLTPAQLALSWCYHREHVSSTIIGATSIPQLEENIKAYDIKLDDETLAKIAKVYKQYTDPTKGY